MENKKWNKLLSEGKKLFEDFDANKAQNLEEDAWEFTKIANHILSLRGSIKTYSKSSAKKLDKVFDELEKAFVYFKKDTGWTEK